jgi:hypothetical protein
MVEPFIFILIGKIFVSYIGNSAYIFLAMSATELKSTNGDFQA